MSLTITQIRTRVKTHLRAEMAAPAVNDLNNNSIDGWANEHTTDVVQLLTSVDYPALIVIDHSITFASGMASLPSNYEKAVALKVTTTDATKKDCDLTFEPKEFSRLDTANFVLTPSINQPKALIGNNKIYIKPISLTAGFFDYVKKHPTINGSQGTVFSEKGDNMLINLILADYYGFIEEFDLQKNCLGVVYGDNAK